MRLSPSNSGRWSASSRHLIWGTERGDSSTYNWPALMHLGYRADRECVVVGSLDRRSIRMCQHNSPIVTMIGGTRTYGLFCGSRDSTTTRSGSARSSETPSTPASCTWTNRPCLCPISGGDWRPTIDRRSMGSISSEGLISLPLSLSLSLSLSRHTRSIKNNDYM